MSGILPVVGRALVGLAGAYLLRALTESGTLPTRPESPPESSMPWRGWAGRRETRQPSA